MTNERRQPSKTLSSGKQYSNMLPPPVPAPPKMAAWARPPMYSPPRTPKVSTGKKAGDLKKVTPPKPVKVSRPKPVKYQNPKPVKRAKPAKRHAQKKSSSCVVM
ncbi:hypothetical protein M501DRAFT_996086 [Patellaria atrata CBS 101060]|uniref:Uncharacterized protein n=1 Tax=Patellaria atrata CBS 101060 TaxID=1346257 RepID=A0A9P4VL02_9PEZI|nr:hypothetical protein M501DRAFT_996086 [Patellaria atrata CBS 101060]